MSDQDRISNSTKGVTGIAPASQNVQEVVTDGHMRWSVSQELGLTWCAGEAPQVHSHRRSSRLSGSGSPTISAVCCWFSVTRSMEDNGLSCRATPPHRLFWTLAETVERQSWWTKGSARSDTRPGFRCPRLRAHPRICPPYLQNSGPWPRAIMLLIASGCRSHPPSLYR